MTHNETTFVVTPRMELTENQLKLLIRANMPRMWSSHAVQVVEALSEPWDEKEFEKRIVVFINNLPQGCAVIHKTLVDVEVGFESETLWENS